MIHENEIQLLSLAWEITPTAMAVYCCKVRIRNDEPIIIYFNNKGIAISWDEVLSARTMVRCVKIYEPQPKAIKVEVIAFLKKQYKYMK